MAGSGTWNDGETKQQAGFWLRFKAAALATISGGVSGVGAIPVKANWGPPKEVVSISAGEQDLIDNFGSETGGGFTAYPCVRLALLGGPREIKVYRMVDGTEKVASITLKDGAAADVVKIDTIYPTTRDFKITVRDSLTNVDNAEVLLYEGTSLIKTFVASKTGNTGVNLVAAINGDNENIWIKATAIADGDGALALITSQPFTGGNAGIGAITSAHYIAAMAAFEAYPINGFALDGTADASIQTSLKAWVERLRAQGKDLIAFTGGTTTDDQTHTIAKARALGFNYEGVVDVGVSGIMDGVTYSSAQVACWVMGAAIGQALTESLTNETTPFDDVTPRLTPPQIDELIAAGSFIMANDGEGVKTERGINTKTSYGTDENDSWSKIKIIRLRGSIQTAMTSTAKKAYIGKIPNSPEGQDALIAALKLYLEGLTPTLLATGSVQVWRDEAKMANAKGDQFYWQYSADEIDNMEQIFGTGNV